MSTTRTMQTATTPMSMERCWAAGSVLMRRAGVRARRCPRRSWARADVRARRVDCAGPDRSFRRGASSFFIGGVGAAPGRAGGADSAWRLRALRRALRRAWLLRPSLRIRLRRLLSLGRGGLGPPVATDDRGLARRLVVAGEEGEHLRRVEAEVLGIRAQKAARA